MEARDPQEQCHKVAHELAKGQAKTKKNYKQILLDEFDVRKLRRLAREGRLYYDTNEPSKEIICEERQQQILNYVSAIDDCVTLEYKSIISEIWKHISTSTELNNRLFMIKGRNANQVNRYRVMAIVNVLLETGVYDQAYTLLDLHHRLQHTTSKDSVYTSCKNYALSFQESRSLKVEIRKICGIKLI